MAYKRNVSLRITLLLEPRQTPSVGIQGRHNVLEAISIHVVHAHQGAAAAVPAKVLRVILPWLVAAWRWLFPPSIGVQNVLSAVSVKITDAETVCCSVALL